MTKRNKVFIWLALAGLVATTGAFIVFSYASPPKSAKPIVTKSATSTAAGSPTTASTPLSTNFEPESVSFISSDVGFILGTARCSSGSCLSIARSQDGGSTWSSIPAPNISLTQPGGPKSSTGSVSKIRFLTINDGYLFGPDLYATHDGGTTWKKIVLLGIAKGYQVASLETDGDKAYLIAGNPNDSSSPNFLFTSRNPSSPFIIQVTPVLPAGSVTELTANPYGLVIATRTEKNIVFFQESGKKNWLKIQVGCSDHSYNPLIALASPGSRSISPQIILACAGNAGAGSQEKTIFESKELRTFEATHSNPPRGGILEALASPDGKTIALAASSGATYLYVSTDYGTTWKTAFSDTTLGGAPIHDLGFTNPTQGFAVIGHATSGGNRTSTFLMTHDQGVSWQEITF